MNYWLVKSEPSTYSWDDFVKLGRDHWDGVRNYQARNNMKSMKEGDRVLFYHSVSGKEVVGIAQVVREAYPDPTTDDERWVVVDLVPLAKLNKPVTLAQVKDTEELTHLHLVRASRLSVMPVDVPSYHKILALAETDDPA